MSIKISTKCQNMTLAEQIFTTRASRRDTMNRLVEVQAAGVGGYVFGGGAGVFSAVKGTQGIDFADGLTLGVESQPGADVGQFAAGAAAEALASAGLIDRQKGGKRPFELGSPGVFGGLFHFIYNHN
ncbi:MAG: hypothetical protein ABII09_10120 [Planctomycetota bacterium]